MIFRNENSKVVQDTCLLLVDSFVCPGKLLKELRAQIGEVVFNTSLTR